MTLSEFIQDPVGEYYICAAVMIWPMIKLFKRAGFKGALAACLIVPMIGHLICAGILAFRSWPMWKGESAI